MVVVVLLGVHHKVSLVALVVALAVIQTHPLVVRERLVKVMLVAEASTIAALLAVAAVELQPLV